MQKIWFLIHTHIWHKKNLKLSSQLNSYKIIFNFVENVAKMLKKKT